MASAAASAVVHNVHPPYAIPVGPRVRPPRLLPGTKAENSNPQPAGPAPRGKVWIQGKWRDPRSNAARATQALQSTRIEKALRHVTHGMNIYAYRHIRTNQVVFSLTRVMQNNKILSQLIFHKKKSKPASLRRDVWTPYFSVHFPHTPAGAEAGLTSYRLLRELSMRRQLAPDRRELVATQEDVERAEARYNPLDLKDMKERHQLKDMPRKGQLLPLKWRAKKLMDQKASSVADLSYVLSLHDDGLSPRERLAEIEGNRAERHHDRSKRARTRINRLRRLEDVKDAHIKEMQTHVEAKPGRVGLTYHAAQRIALEHGGTIAGGAYGANQAGSLADVERVTQRQTSSGDNEEISTEAEPAEPESQANEDSRTINVVWADMRDGHFAENWTTNVFHSDMEPKAALMAQHRLVTAPASYDAETNEFIEEQAEYQSRQISSTPHVAGRDIDTNTFKSSDQIRRLVEERQREPAPNAQRNYREQLLRRMIELQRSGVDLAAYQNLAERYPVYASQLRKMEQFSGLIARLLRIEQQMDQFRGTTVSADLVEQHRLVAGEIPEDWIEGLPGFEDLERERQKLILAAETSAVDINQGPLSSKLQELDDRLVALKVHLALQAHAEDLRKLDDPNWEAAAQSSYAETYGEAADLPSIQSHRSKPQLDDDVYYEPPRSLWGRVKGVFGRSP